MKKNISLFSFGLLFLLFVNCSKTTVFKDSVTFPNDNWAFENKAITFKAPLTNSEKPYAVKLDLELIGTPNVGSFSATFTILTPNGGKTIKPIVFNFNKPKEPYIQGKTANEKIYRMTVYPKKYFSETGTYTFEVDQFSNKADNYGIRSLSLKIEKVREE